jgi:transcription elongation factor Elf1
MTIRCPYCDSQNYKIYDIDELLESGKIVLGISCKECGLCFDVTVVITDGYIEKIIRE